ncbi:MAG: hypothetical protein JWP81_1617 [Ferruginibacter sp.]|nr:hypothetical protein [Ferruginibacter sp.]
MSAVDYIKKILKELLPYENYTLITRLTTADVQKRLSDNIEPNKAYRFNPFGENIKPYEGVISGNTFTINRIIHYRNSFLPIITGQIADDAGKTCIKIKMRLHLLVLIFVSFWLYTTGKFCVIVLTQNPSLKDLHPHPDASINPSLIPFIMFTVMLVMTLGGFKTESKKSKRFLSSLLEEEK